MCMGRSGARPTYILFYSTTVLYSRVICPLLLLSYRNVADVAGACLAVLVILSAYNVSVLTVEHILTAIIVLGAIVAVSR